MMDKIPAHIRAKVVDKDWSETFIFEEMKCDHSPNAKKYEKIKCDKCNFDDREIWLETELTKRQPTDTTKDEKGITKTLGKIIVSRGSFDDCIGIKTYWQ